MKKVHFRSLFIGITIPLAALLLMASGVLDRFDTIKAKEYQLVGDDGQVIVRLFDIVKLEQRIKQLEDSNMDSNDEKLTGDLNETTEVYARLDKRWRGSSKHLRALQGKSDTLRLDLNQEIEDTKSRFDDAKSKFEYHKKKQDQLNTDLDDKIDDNQRDLKKSIKNIKRDLDKLERRRVKPLETDILGINAKINQILQLEIIQKAIVKKSKG